MCETLNELPLENEKNNEDKAAKRALAGGWPENSLSDKMVFELQHEWKE